LGRAYLGVEDAQLRARVTPTLVTARRISSRQQRRQAAIIAFPDLNKAASELSQTNLILPEPTDFLAGFPEVSVIRPTLTQNSGAVAAVKSLTADRLFEGQSPEFFSTLMAMSTAADAAHRAF
jgi:hypothetical protein